jgi:hypothetical protein
VRSFSTGGPIGAVRPRSVLLVAWLFPPHESVGAKRPWRLAKHLPGLGWNVTVLTQSCVPARFRDEQTPMGLPEGAWVHRGYDPPWLARAAATLDAWSVHRSRGTEGEASPPASGPSRAQRWTPMEPAAVHVPHAISQALALCRARRPDAVLTTSYPFSSHAVGMAVSRITGIPWVADLRDPWTLHWNHAHKTRPVRAVERALESATFARARAITVTTETLREAYRAAYPAEADKIHAIRNAFDPIPLPPRSRHPGPARLVHFGHVYGGARSLRPMLSALAAEVRARGLDRRDVVLENYGRFSHEDLSFARERGIEGLLSIAPQRPYAEGMASLRGAALLLLPAWETAFGPLFLPAKLYDYLLVGAPILAVGDNPELGDILARTRAGTLARPDDERSLRAVIARALDGQEEGFAPDPVETARFSAGGMAESFASLLDRLA